MPIVFLLIPSYNALLSLLFTKEAPIEQNKDYDRYR